MTFVLYSLELSREGLSCVDKRNPKLTVPDRSGDNTARPDSVTEFSVTSVASPVSHNRLVSCLLQENTENANPKTYMAEKNTLRNIN